MRHKRNGYFSVSDLKNRLKVLGFTPNSRAVFLTPFFLAAALRACRPCFLSPDLLTLVLASIPYSLSALATISFERPSCWAVCRMDFFFRTYRRTRSSFEGVSPVDGLPRFTSIASAFWDFTLAIVRIIGHAGRLLQWDMYPRWYIGFKVCTRSHFFKDATWNKLPILLPTISLSFLSLIRSLRKVLIPS